MVSNTPGKVKIREENRRRVGHSILVLAAILALVSSTWLFIGFLHTTQRQESKRILLSSAIQDVRVIEMKIQASLYHLEAMASLLESDRNLPFDTVSISTDRQRLAFSSLALVDPDGKVVSGNQLGFDVGTLAEFKRGTIAVAIIADNPSLALLVPIRPGVQVEATLVGLYDFDTIRSIFAESSTTPHAMRAFTDATGALLYPDVLPDGVSTDLFQYLSTARLPAGESFEQVSKDYGQGKPIVVEIEYQGEQYWLTTVAIPATPWSLVQFVPASDLLVHESIMALGTFILIVSVLLFVAIIVLSALYVRIRMLDSSAKAERERLPDSVPGGEFSYVLDGGMEFIEVSDSFVALLGYTKEEFNETFANKFVLMVYGEDRQLIVEQRQNQHVGLPAVMLQYRVETKAGHAMWLADWAQVEQPSSGPAMVKSVVIDVSAPRSIAEEVRASEERYRFVEIQAKTVVFEWDLRTGTFYRSPNWKDVFGYEPVDNSADHIFAMERVHPDDRDTVAGLFEACRTGHKKGSAQIRFRNGAEAYLWVQIQFSALPLASGAATERILGRMTDIDEQWNMQDKLKMQALTDPLTSLFHKGAVKDSIDSFLRCDGLQGIHALAIIDIDHFKDFNDTFGHSRGDVVLIQFVTTLRKLLADTDHVVGRVGGDELLVLLKDVGTVERTADLARRLTVGLHRTITVDHGIERELSASLGIAVYPQDGTTYDVLFEAADKALYHVKKHGRNNFHLYDSAIDAIPSKAGVEEEKPR